MVQQANEFSGFRTVRARKTHVWREYFRFGRIAPGLGALKAQEGFDDSAKMDGFDRNVFFSVGRNAGDIM
jgi:hypothetical protein